ncbi:MAG: HupE/UreJ family protein, partial [Pseudomonadota bacterium]
GVLVALKVRAPLVAGMAVAGAFAVFHGHAHGAEMPGAAAPALYAAGFLLATGVLHAVGVAAALALGKALAAKGDRLVRAGGAAIAASGAVLAVI